MVSEDPIYRNLQSTETLVLILVVMEDGLRAKDLETNGMPNPVLILVVMEDGLRVAINIMTTP